MEAPCDGDSEPALVEVSPKPGVLVTERTQGGPKCPLPAFSTLLGRLRCCSKPCALCLRLCAACYSSFCLFSLCNFVVSSTTKPQQSADVNGVNRNFSVLEPDSVQGGHGPRGEKYRCATDRAATGLESRHLPHQRAMSALAPAANATPSSCRTRPAPTAAGGAPLFDAWPRRGTPAPSGTEPRRRCEPKRVPHSRSGARHTTSASSARFDGPRGRWAVHQERERQHSLHAQRVSRKDRVAARP